MENNNTVCACNKVKVEDIRNTLESTPTATFEEVCSSTSIGTRCKSCLNESCSKIEVNPQTAYNSLIS